MSAYQATGFPTRIAMGSPDDRASAGPGPAGARTDTPSRGARKYVAPPGGVALVAGGSGLVGSALLSELLLRPGWTKVIAVARRPLRWPHRRLEELVVDFDTLGEQRPLPRADVAICCVGTTLREAGSRERFAAVDRGAVARFAQAAKAGGISRFVVVAAHGASPRALSLRRRVKGLVEQDLRAMGFASLGIARPSLLLGARPEPRRDENTALFLSGLLGPLGRLMPGRPIEARVVARALVKLAEDRWEGVRIADNLALHELGSWSIDEERANREILRASLRVA